MVRTQIQITEKQSKALKGIAARRGVSVAEVVREAVEQKIRSAGIEVSREERIRRALAAMNRFRSGKRDVSERHDDYLAEAYRK